MNKKHWVFLRGLTRGNIHWGPFPEVFRQSKSDIECEYLELPGNGSHSHCLTPTSAEDVVSFLREQTQFCREGKKINLCGISLGGMMAMKWAETHPHEVENVYIINTSLEQCSPFYHRLRPGNYITLMKTILMRDPKKQEEQILKITSNRFAEKTHHLPAFVEFSKKNRFNKVNFFRQLSLARNTMITGLAVPLHIITSEKDRLVHFKCSQAIAQSFKAREFIHKTAGHDLPLDEPQWLAEKLLS